MQLPMWNRRDFLKAAGLGAISAAIPPWLLAGRALAAPNQPADVKTKHLVFIALAGGVRSKETILAPGNVPNLMKLAERGILAPQEYAIFQFHEWVRRQMQEAGS